MNILIFSWRGPGHPNAGGAEISTHEHAKGWVQAGHDVTLFTAAFIGCKEQEVVDGLNIIRRGRQIFGVQWEAFKWYLSKDHPKYDLIIDQFHGIPFFTPLYVKVKKLAFIHEVTKEVWKLNPLVFPFNFITAILGSVLEPLIFQLYRKNYFMTVSESTKKDLVDWGIPQKNITVIHNGLNMPRIKFYPKEKKKTLIFLGALSKDKGIEDALKIFSILDKTGNFQFWIVGKGDFRYLEYLKSQARKLGIDKKVKFWGFVSKEKKYELLTRAHILINPSIREGWGFVVMEAASVGTPAVGYNVPGLRDSILDGKTGILSKEYSVDSLADEIVKLLENEERYSKIGRNAIIWSKNFSWDKATKMSTDLINKIFVTNAE